MGNESINIGDEETVLNAINNCSQDLFKTFIIIAETNSRFKKSDLVFLNERYNICCFFGVGWRKIVRTINAALNDD